MHSSRLMCCRRTAVTLIELTTSEEQFSKVQDVNDVRQHLILMMCELEWNRRYHCMTSGADVSMLSFEAEYDISNIHSDTNYLKLVKTLLTVTVNSNA